jgi:AraC-like DNA-binding protein
MLVIARVSGELAARLRDAIGVTHVLHNAKTDTELQWLARTKVADVAVIEFSAAVDPNVSLNDNHSLHELRSVDPDLPVVAYVALSQQVKRGLVSVIRSGHVQGFMIVGVDDTPRLAAAELEAVALPRPARTVLAAIEGYITKLPPKTRSAVKSLFAEPSAFRDVGTLARAAHVSRRTLNRQLARCKIAHADALLRAARVTAAYSLMRSRATRGHTIAERIGYSRYEGLIADTRRVTSLTPKQLHDSVVPEEFVDRLIDYVQRDQTSEV